MKIGKILLVFIVAATSVSCSAMHEGRGGNKKKKPRLQRRGYVAPKTIHEAAHRGDKEAVKAMITHNPEVVNQKDHSPGFQGDRPLHQAAFKGDDRHIEIIRLLLGNKADRYARNARGLTPLHSAAFAGKLESLGALCNGLNIEERSAYLQMENNNKETALALASFRGHEEVMRALIEAMPEGELVAYLQMVDKNRLTAFWFKNPKNPFFVYFFYRPQGTIFGPKSDYKVITPAPF